MQQKFLAEHLVAGDGEEYVRLLRRVGNERILNVNFLGSVSDAEKGASSSKTC